MKNKSLRLITILVVALTMLFTSISITGATTAAQSQKGSAKISVSYKGSKSKKAKKAKKTKKKSKKKTKKKTKKKSKKKSSKSKKKSKKSKKSKKAKKSSKSKKLKKLKKKIKAYNKKIYRQGQGKLNSKSIKKSPVKLSKYGIKNNVYGQLKIKKINVNLPIYLGCNDKTMSKGIAHLSQTSIPFGGKNTNAVLAGHNGWGRKPFLKNLNKLKKGNKIKIKTPFKTLTYKVKKIKMLHSNKLNKMLIKTGKDRVTLFTCIGGPGTKKRLVVFCDRCKK